MLKTPELAMPRSRKVTTICNGKREVWTDCEQAKAYFLEIMMTTEGEERDRAECVYIQLLHGLDECSDEDEYCALKYENDFDKALRAAVNHNGDSDSTGAVCGNILGAYLGYHAIPQKYKECLELHDQIMDTADQLCNEFVDVLYSKHGNVTL